MKFTRLDITEDAIHMYIGTCTFGWIIVQCISVHTDCWCTVYTKYLILLEQLVFKFVYFLATLYERLNTMFRANALNLIAIKNQASFKHQHFHHTCI